MALDPSNSSNFEQLALKGLTEISRTGGYWWVKWWCATLCWCCNWWRAQPGSRWLATRARWHPCCDCRPAMRVVRQVWAHLHRSIVIISRTSLVNSVATGPRSAWRRSYMPCCDDNFTVFCLMNDISACHSLVSVTL